MTRYPTYLLIDLGALVVPLLFSFHPKIRFYEKWGAFFPALLGTAFPFLLWDALYVRLGVWGFNPSYLLGLSVYNLPLEEILFFVCIPYSCVFTYHCLGKFLRISMSRKTESLITIALIVCLCAGAAAYFPRLYTAVTFFALALLLVYVGFIAPNRRLGAFYISYCALLVPFFIVNGILTGTGIEKPIVWYNNAETIGVRLLTIPVEDVFYGMLLILLTVTLYERLLEKKRR